MKQSKVKEIYFKAKERYIKSLSTLGFTRYGEWENKREFEKISKSPNFQDFCFDLIRILSKKKTKTIIGGKKK